MAIRIRLSPSISFIYEGFPGQKFRRTFHRRRRFRRFYFLRNPSTVKPNSSFGSYVIHGDGATDDTAGIQAALNAGDIMVAPLNLRDCRECNHSHRPQYLMSEAQLSSIRRVSALACYRSASPQAVQETAASSGVSCRGPISFPATPRAMPITPVASAEIQSVAGDCERLGNTYGNVLIETSSSAMRKAIRY